MKKPSIVFLVGYSVRSLAEACSFAGLNCVAVDHFGDADTRAFASGRWILLDLIDERLISGKTLAAIEEIASDFGNRQSVAFLLAGGMENLGDAVEQLRCIGTVFGPDEMQRSRLRDWRFLNSAANAADIEFPKTLSESDEAEPRKLERIENWLWKPMRGAGGLRIVRESASGLVQGEGYWQQHISGQQLGVTCVLQAAGCSIVGATKSLDAKDWPGPSEFIYRGSIGPVHLSFEVQRRVNDLCIFIRQQLGFSGFLQFDFIQSDDDRLWLLECNPRWTAATEVLLGHCENGESVNRLVFDGILGGGPYSNDEPAKTDCVFGKAIVYANKQVHLTKELALKLQLHSRDSVGFAWLADLPNGAQTIEQGHPIATVRTSLRNQLKNLSETEIRTQLLIKLRACVARVYELLEIDESSSGCKS